MTSTNQMVLKEWRGAGEISTLIARIEATGELVLEGYDAGELVKQQWGDWDYEYWLRVDQANVARVLLLLIKERFASASEFQTWLETQAIPSAFESWT